MCRLIGTKKSGNSDTTTNFAELSWNMHEISQLFKNRVFHYLRTFGRKTSTTDFFHTLATVR